MDTKTTRNLFLIIFITIAFIVIYIIINPSFGHPVTDNIVTQMPDNRAVYVGAWVGGFWNNDSVNTQSIKDFETAIGKKLALVNFYTGWQTLNKPSFLQDLNEISANGWIPMISSNPSLFSGCQDSSGSIYKAIVQGNCDDFLRSVADNLKTYNKPILFRFAWEMNLPDMYWSMKNTKSSPQDFINAWKHFHDVLVQDGATNVKWVLSFNTTSGTTTPYKDLFPGDNYIDWVAIDGYNWGDTQSWSGWTSFNGVFKSSYNELTALTTKPVMLSEVNSAPTGGDKSTWLTDMLSVQIPKNYPQISAIVFFDEDKTSLGETDWRIEKSQDYVNAVKTALSNKIYKSSF